MHSSFSLNSRLCLVLLLLGTCAFHPALSQQYNPNRCGQEELQRIKRDNGIPHTSREDFDRQMENLLRQPYNEARNIITIPVVVHVVHDNEAVGIGANITGAQVRSQIDVLNEDFRRRLNTNGYNQDSVGADVEIEFCLAVVDPDGNTMPEPGIDRVDRLLEGFASPPYTFSYHQNTIQLATYWDPDRYMNIWTAPLANDFLGFAELPDSTTPPHKDGIVITPTAFGRKGTAATPYNLGRTTTHEVGHYMGLLHIWGDGGCSVDDGCLDTPESNQPNYTCNVDRFSCGSREMFENYMDYSNDACMNIFTQCQKNRMRAVMSNFIRRTSLINSTVCQGTGAPLAGLEASQNFACEGSQIQFFNQSINATNTWSWSFPGGMPSTSTLENPVVTYPNAGVYDVSLTVTNTIGSSSITESQFINITPSTNSVFFYEDFESGLGDWQVINSDGRETWELASVNGSRNGLFAASVRFFIYSQTGEIDELISPVFDLSTYFNLELSFDHAYRNFKSGAGEDSLVLMASTDGGQTYPFKLFEDGEDGSFNFATKGFTGNDFTPTTDDDWCYSGSPGASCNTIDLSNFAGEGQFRLKFVSKNGYGNNLYIDNIQISGSCSASTVSVEQLAPPSSPVSIYPNPTRENLFVDLDTPGKIKIELWNYLGQQVKSWEMNHDGGSPISLPLEGVSQGTYLVKIKGNGWEEVKKIAKL